MLPMRYFIPLLYTKALYTSCRHLTLIFAVFCTYAATAQTAPAAGRWTFVVKTDTTRIPADMRENFPTVEYEKCLSGQEIASPRGFGLQASPAMTNRCSTEGWTMAEGKFSYKFQCDSGSTLTGDAQGHYSEKQVSLTVVSRPRPVVRGVETIYQNIVAKRVGACEPAAP
jgi:hypothetical protein